MLLSATTHTHAHTNTVTTVSKRQSLKNKQLQTHAHTNTHMDTHASYSFPDNYRTVTHGTKRAQNATKIEDGFLSVDKTLL